MKATTRPRKTVPQKFALFLDESGDHELRSLDPDFPVFCLAGVMFEFSYYHAVARPKVDALKLQCFGSTEVVLHSSEIRRHEGPFAVLGDRDRRQDFYEALNDLMLSLDFTILAVVILKTAHIQSYRDLAQHPYDLSLEFILERFSRSIRRRGLLNTGYLLAESRGQSVDRLLKGEYERLCQVGTDYQGLDNITGMWLNEKSENIAGLQIADLVAYPIATKVLRPDQENRAFDVLLPKINAAPRHKGSYLLGYGLKIFPHANRKHHLLWGQHTKREP